jgi:hypothetical protein
MTPTNMAKGLLVVGIVMIVLAVPLSVIATSAVQGTVDSASVRTAENTWESEDWLHSVSYRDYYAYDVTNADEVNEFPAGWAKTPNFELVGPYTYKVITDRIFVGHNMTIGTYEYTESTTYESCFVVDCEGNGPGEDPTTQVTNLNIPYATLRVASIPQAFEIIRDAMEARFAMKMIELEGVENDLEIQSWFATSDDFTDFLYGGDGTKNPTGVLAEGPSDEPIYYGVEHFVESANSNKDQTMSNYGITNSTGMDFLKDLTGNWFNSVSTYEVSGEHLVDDERDPYPENATENITASDYANISFGGVDPLDGSLPLFGLNSGGLYSPLTQTIVMSSTKGGELLDKMMTTEGAVGLMYMYSTGVTPPLTGNGYGAGGLELSKYTGYSGGFGINAFEAFALEHLTMDVLYNSYIPSYLAGYGSHRWTTLSVNEWLFGWHDSAAAYVESGDEENYSAGWFSLDANASYYLTPELAALGVTSPENPPSQIVRYTGEQDLKTLGMLVTQNNVTELDWHSEEMYEGTYGLVDWEPNGLRRTSGGWVSGTNINCEEHYYLKYDLAGYIVADIPCVGMSDVKGINSLHYSIKTNATERLIQAKLLNTKTILDALPGSIPVYFASDADFYAEPVTGYIIKGDVTSTFYLDLAALNDPTKEGPTSTDDLQPVFAIEIHPELGDDQAEQMQSQIYTNKNIVTWWTNFDTPFDFILPVLILISAVCFVFASKKFSEEELSSLVKEDTFEESE